MMPPAMVTVMQPDAEVSDFLGVDSIEIQRRWRREIDSVCFDSW
jgi:hypothetical protein